MIQNDSGETEKYFFNLFPEKQQQLHEMRCLIEESKHLLKQSLLVSFFVSRTSACFHFLVQNLHQHFTIRVIMEMLKSWLNVEALVYTINIKTVFIISLPQVRTMLLYLAENIIVRKSLTYKFITWPTIIFTSTLLLFPEQVKFSKVLQLFACIESDRRGLSITQKRFGLLTKVGHQVE